MTYESYQRELHPPPLRGDMGEAFHGVLGRAKDALVTLAKARTAHQQGLFGAPRLESVRAHTRRTVTGTVFVSPHVRRVRHFASGSQSPGQPTGFAEVGKDVGVAAEDVEPRGPSASPMDAATAMAISVPVELPSEPIIIPGSPAMVYLPKRLCFWASSPL